MCEIDGFSDEAEVALWLLSDDRIGNLQRVEPILRGVRARDSARQMMVSLVALRSDLYIFLVAHYLDLGASINSF